MARSPLPPLLYASTTNADQLFFSRVGVHDPFISFGVGDRRLTVQSALEFGRVRKARTFDEVLPLEEWRTRAQKRYPKRKAGVAEIITELARVYRIRGFRVPDDFPAALFLKLRALGLRIETADGPVFPEREIKTPAEAAAIRQGNRLSAIGFTVTEEILRAARIRRRRLYYEGRPLTSERLRFAIDSAILAAGGRADDTIVAGGDQACDPHNAGHGPLHAHSLIIVDIFPRVVATGYFGDMTRTYLKGRASDAQRKLCGTVQAALQADVDGRSVHQKVVDTFDAAGYKTRHGKNGSVGFFHGTGHGLGLAVHEPPNMSGRMSMLLKKDTVVTVEPGLYYPGLGGCRFEDVVQVTRTGARLLSRHPYNWEIR